MSSPRCVRPLWSNEDLRYLPLARMELCKWDNVCTNYQDQSLFPVIIDNSVWSASLLNVTFESRPEKCYISLILYHSQIGFAHRKLRLVGNLSDLLDQIVPGTFIHFRKCFPHIWRVQKLRLMSYFTDNKLQMCPLSRDRHTCLRVSLFFFACDCTEAMIK